jgi:adenine deaminase
MELTDLLKTARGDQPADLALRGGRVVNVFTGEIIEADVAIAGGRIAGVGLDYEAREEVDVSGLYVCPGLIDSHVHIESSMVVPFQFARAVVPRGTTTVVADPHEVANVAGKAGIHYMLNCSEGIPLQVLVALPSCVPATEMGTAGAELTAEDLASLADLPRVAGLAEFMNVPGAVLGLPGALQKLEAFQDRIIDGHAPGVTGKWLQAYVAAGPGSDHESTTADEMREKLRLGMYVFVREATGAKNLRDLLPAITEANSRRCGFSTDDRHPADLMEEGHVDYLLRLAVSEGLDPVTAMQMATLNASDWFGLRDRGAVAPGRRADLAVFADLKEFRARYVLSEGRVVARGGEAVGEWHAPEVDDSAVRSSVQVDWDSTDLEIPVQGERIRVIGIVPDQVVTEQLVDVPKVVDGAAVADPDRDLLKLAVIERHRATGNVGLGFVRGFGLKRGAIAGSVAHDAHNLSVAGCDDTSMMTAAHAIEAMGGGLVAAAGDEVLASLPLPIAGLMSDQPLEAVQRQMEQLVSAAHDLGSELHDPYMALGFLALEVIPALKLTDQGLVDVDKFDFVPLWVD